MQQPVHARKVAAGPGCNLDFQFVRSLIPCLADDLTANCTAELKGF